MVVAQLKILKVVRVLAVYVGTENIERLVGNHGESFLFEGINTN